tara:strand:- start:75 stop:785 length:711 start_codon:yes stop_codon:yes gene_type:complete
VVLHSIELLAAIAGLRYLTKSRDHSVRLFVIYLWVNFIIEIIGMYPMLVYYNNLGDACSDDSWLQLIKNSKFYGNSWLYSIHSYFVVILIGLYYWRLIKTTTYRSIIRNLIVVYCVFAVLYVFLKDKLEFLQKLNYFAEEIVILSCISLYFLELLKSDKFLKFYHSVHFYIGISLFIWYLCVMPIFLFDDFFTELNTLYNDFRIQTILTFNVILYLCCTFGFYYALRNRKELVKNR